MQTNARQEPLGASDTKKRRKGNGCGATSWPASVGRIDAWTRSGSTERMQRREAGARRSADLSSAVQGQFFGFFVGIQAVTFDSAIGDHLDTVQLVRLPAVQRLFTLRDRVSLRADLGQSQSGNSSLSPRACRVEPRPPNWPYRRFYRSPLPVPLDTTVGAPLWARRSLAKGGRTDRWTQISAIRSRTILLWFRIFVVFIRLTLAPCSMARLKSVLVLSCWLFSWQST
jgi:hypothetical protein